MKRRKEFLIYILLLALTGCSSMTPRLGFETVKKEISDRTGKKVHWNLGTEADEKVGKEIKALLEGELSIEDAVQIALLNNRNLQATFEDLSIAQADLVSAGLLTNPIFDAEVRFGRNGGTSVEAALVQNFIDVLFIPLRKKVAAAAFEATKLRVAGTVLDLAGEVKESFIEHQAAIQDLEMRKQVLAATEASELIAKKLRAAGNITELDYQNESALFEESKINVRKAEVEILRTKGKLNTLMGLWGKDTSWRAEERLPSLPKDEVSSENLEKEAIERSIELAVARKELEETANSLGLARPFGIFPELGIGATAAREPEGESAFGPAFSVPLPIFGQGQPAIAAANALLRSVSERYHGTAVAIRSEVRTAYASLMAAREEAQYYAKVILPLREKLVDETTLHYNAMQVSAFQLLNAKQKQIEAGSSYIEALQSYWLSRIKLQQILNGRMTGFDEPNRTRATSEQDSDEGAH